MTITTHTSQTSAMPERCARTDQVAVCLRDHGHPGLCVSPEMSASVGVRRQASDGHTIDPDPEHGAFDVCLHCKQAIQVDVYGSGRLATMVGRNFECYGK